MPGAKHRDRFGRNARLGLECLGGGECGGGATHVDAGFAPRVVCCVQAEGLTGSGEADDDFDAGAAGGELRHHAVLLVGELSSLGSLVEYAFEVTLLDDGRLVSGSPVRDVDDREFGVEQFPRGVGGGLALVGEHSSIGSDRVLVWRWGRSAA
jgi:hypothetical protein